MGSIFEKLIWSTFGWKKQLLTAEAVFCVLQDAIKNTYPELQKYWRILWKVNNAGWILAWKSSYFLHAAAVVLIVLENDSNCQKPHRNTVIISADKNVKEVDF